jgi:predicted nucleic acid-binding protein
VQVLIDAGPIIAYFNENDAHHNRVDEFYEEFTGQFITTLPVITEAIWQLRANTTVQNYLFADLEKEIYQLESLVPADFKRIAELNLKYEELPADFADLSLIAVSERLNLPKIFTLDGDFNIYRRFKTSYFEHVKF